MHEVVARNAGKNELSKSKFKPGSPLVGLAVHIARNILNVVGAKLLTEGRHGVFAIRDLGDNGLDLETTCKVLLKLRLLDLLLRHDAVVATGVARRAVRLENGLTIFQVSSHGWTAARNRSEKPQRDADCQRVP